MAAFGMFGLFSASSKGAFTAPVTLSNAGADAEVAQVAIDADGDALVVWQNTTNGRIQARARSSAGVLGSIQALSPLGQYAFDPQVAIDPNGNALVVWSRFDGSGDFCCDRVQARARSAAGALSAVQTLSAAGFNAFESQVAVAPSGNALVVWHRSDDSIQARARSAAGTLGAVQTLVAAPPGEDPSIPQVAIDSNGNAVVVWQRFLDGITYRIQARARSAAGALSAVQTLSAPGAPAYRPQLAIDTDGDALAVWARYDSTTQCGGSHCLRIQARARSAAGTLATVQTISPAARNSDSPEVAMDPGGDALAVWTNATGIQARARSAAGTLGAVQTLSTTAYDFPEVAMDADGDGVAVWAKGTVNSSCCDRIESRTRAAAGTLGPLQTISGTGMIARRPQVAIDGLGHALAVWERLDGANWRVQAAAGP